MAETGIAGRLVLFAYRTSLQESTQESPFHLLYGCDARIPTAAATKLTLMTTKPSWLQVFLTLGSWLSRIYNKPQNSRNISMTTIPPIPSISWGTNIFVYQPGSIQGKN